MAAFLSQNFLCRTNHGDVDQGAIRLDFSVDRLTFGAGGAVTVEAANGQQAGDIFRTTESFAAPGTFAGTLTPGAGPVPTWAGVLPAPLGGPPLGLPKGNTQVIDDSALGLLCFGSSAPAPCPPPGTPAGPVPPLIPPGSLDNVDAFDRAVFDADGDGAFDRDAYFTVNPDNALITGVSAADIFTVAAGDPGAAPVPYAPAPSMGLDSFGSNTDSIDALIMFDNGGTPISMNGLGPGSIEGVLDYTLFSLAPGSATLAGGLVPAGPTMFSDADIFFTDFTGIFATYATALDLGLMLSPDGGLPTFSGFDGDDNVDALDIAIVPEPASFALFGAGLAGLAFAGRRRRT